MPGSAQRGPNPTHPSYRRRRGPLLISAAAFSLGGGPLPARLAAGKMTTVTYRTQNGTGLATDVYEPPASAVRPAPVVLYVHGGGFALGDRQVSPPTASGLPRADEGGMKSK